jgi:dihydropyrimidinase
MFDIVIENGKVVFPHRTSEVTLAIDDGKIVLIGSGSKMPKGEKTINARGKFVLPGGIDTHDHTGDGGVESFYLGSQGQSWGGTTTALNFALNGLRGVKEKSILMEESVIDFALHSIINNITPDDHKSLDEIKEIIKYGVPSFKLFTVYGNPADDNTVLRVLEQCKVHGGILCLHAENNSMIEYNVKTALKEGHKEAIYHALTRPPVTEAESVNMAICLSSLVRSPYLNVHLTIKEGVELIREARRRGGLVYGETCPHYLTRTEEDLKGPHGNYLICTPPFRTREHIEALWKGLADGTLSVVGSDSVPNTAAMKDGKTDFSQVPNGCPGKEFRLPIIYSEGVVKRHISINKLSEFFSTNAAKIYGLYPQKGVIDIGSDADLVILDPKTEKTITNDMQFFDTGYCVYEGMKVKGWPSTTISKGQVIWEDGAFHGKRGSGKFLKRTLPKKLFTQLIA